MKTKDILLFILIAWIVLISARLSFAQEIESPSVQYVKQFRCLLKRPGQIKHTKYLINYWIPLVEKYSKKYNFDPLLITIVISLESSFNTSLTDENAIGAAGEKGLLQCGKQCARHLYKGEKTPEQWLESGFSWLAKARASCDGSLIQTLTMYHLGKRCSPPSKAALRRLRIYRKREKR